MRVTMDYNNSHIGNIPLDLNAETLLTYYPEGFVKVAFKGLHKRNSYRDILEVESGKNGGMVLSLGRNSLYDSLPEYVFHPIDRFDNLTGRESKEKFSEEYARQEEEKRNAYRLFAPIDLMLLSLRLDVRKVIDKYSSEDKVLQDVLGDSLTEDQRNNTFIKKMIPFLPSCKDIRGDRTLLTMLLRKILMDEGIGIEVGRKKLSVSDEEPRYEDKVEGEIGSLYVGNEFEERVCVYNVFYWPADSCDKDFLRFMKEIEDFRGFVQDYFLSVDSVLEFDIHNDDAPALRLNDTVLYNYLNYNTNL